MGEKQRRRRMKGITKLNLAKKKGKC